MGFGTEETTTVGVDCIQWSHFVRVHDLGVLVAPALVVDVEKPSAVGSRVGRRGVNRRCCLRYRLRLGFVGAFRISWWARIERALMIRGRMESLLCARGRSIIERRLRIHNCYGWD